MHSVVDDIPGDIVAIQTVKGPDMEGQKMEIPARIFKYIGQRDSLHRPDVTNILCVFLPVTLLGTSVLFPSTALLYQIDRSKSRADIRNC